MTFCSSTTVYVSDRAFPWSVMYFALYRVRTFTSQICKFPSNIHFSISSPLYVFRKARLFSSTPFCRRKGCPDSQFVQIPSRKHQGPHRANYGTQPRRVTRRRSDEPLRQMQMMAKQARWFFWSFWTSFLRFALYIILIFRRSISINFIKTLFLKS